MSINVLKQIEQIENDITKKRIEIKKLNQQLDELKVRNLYFEIGSLLTRSEDCPYYESEFDKYIVVLTNDAKISFAKVDYWYTVHTFNSIDEAKEFIKQDSGDYVKWEVSKLNFEVK